MNKSLLLFALWMPALPVLAMAPSELEAALAVQGDPVQGKAAYALCRGCHNADASGRAEANYPRLAGQHPQVLIKQMVDVRAGKRENVKMHPFIAKDVVSTEEVAHIAAYLATLPTPAGNSVGEGRALARGKTLYDQDCARCHGPRGEGEGARFIPRISGQHYGYLVRENKAIQAQTGQRKNADPEMVKAIRGYTYRDIAAVSDYLARLGTTTK